MVIRCENDTFFFSPKFRQKAFGVRGQNLHRGPPDVVCAYVGHDAGHDVDVESALHNGAADHTCTTYFDDLAENPGCDRSAEDAAPGTVAGTCASSSARLADARSPIAVVTDGPGLRTHT